MFSSIKNFLHRHRRKFLVTGAVVGGAYLITSFAQKKLREWQEREARRFLDMSRKRQHFDNNARTCNQTIISLSKIVTETILKSINTDEIVQKLQENPDNRLELWERLKIMIFTRVCVMVYALCILHVMLRIQLNIIGGYLFKESVYEKDKKIDGNLQAQYLSLCHHFVSDGVTDLIKQIENAVKKVVEPVQLKKKVTLQEVEQMFWSIQTILCTDSSNIDPVKQMTKYLTNHRELGDKMLDQIVKETMDILESEDVTSHTMISVGRCFSSIMDATASIFVSQPASKNHLELGREYEPVVTNGAMKLAPNPFVDVHKVDMHFVKFLPLLDKLLTENCKDNGNIPEMLTQQLILNDKAKVLGANIYEAFSSP